MTATPAANPANPPVGLEDAFRQVFGSPSISVLRRVWSSANGPDRCEQAKMAFVRGLAYSLPSISDNIADPLSVNVHRDLLERRPSNVFVGNPHACGIAACATALSDVPPDVVGRRIDESSIRLYLAFTTIASTRIVKKYSDVLPSGEDHSYYASRFEELVTELRGSIEEAIGSPLRRGINHLLEALLLVREKRVEERPLTLDLRLPLTCSWDLILEAASRSEGAPGHENPAMQVDLLRALSNYSASLIVDELESIGKHLGRGVAQMTLRGEPPESSKKGLFMCERLWENHQAAPLSRLYDLDWNLPQSSEVPDVRVVLLGNGTVSIYLQGDPFFEYLLGYWRYVDIAGKTRVLSAVLEPERERAEYLVPTLYRVARMAHHLAYHNHGAILEIDLEPPALTERNLHSVRIRWDIDQIAAGLPLLRLKSEGEEAEPSLSPTGYGRFAYALATHDGISVWSVTKDSGLLEFEDFGQIEDIRRGEIAASWKERARELGIEEESLGGGRHHAAYQRSMSREQGRAVFCISQDGFIDVFVAKDALRLR